MKYTLEDLMIVVTKNENKLPISLKYAKKIKSFFEEKRTFTKSKLHQTNKYTFRLFYCKDF